MLSLFDTFYKSLPVGTKSLLYLIKRLQPFLWYMHFHHLIICYGKGVWTARAVVQYIIRRPIAGDCFRRPGTARTAFHYIIKRPVVMTVFLVDLPWNYGNCHPAHHRKSSSWPLLSRRPSVNLWELPFSKSSKNRIIGDYLLEDPGLPRLPFSTSSNIQRLLPSREPYVTCHRLSFVALWILQLEPGWYWVTKRMAECSAKKKLPRYEFVPDRLSQSIRLVRLSPD